MYFLTQLVEYFITGSLALVWAIPAWNLLEANVAFSSTFSGLPSACTVAIFTSAVYTLGMIIDKLTSIVLNPFKKTIEQIAIKKKGIGDTTKLTPDDFHTTAIFAYAHAHSAELGRLLTFKSSRDRIARGALGNILIIGFIWAMGLLGEFQCGLGEVAGICGIWALLLYICCLAWKAFQKTSAEYEVYIYEYLISLKENPMPKFTPSKKRKIRFQAKRRKSPFDIITTLARVFKSRK